MKKLLYCTTVASLCWLLSSAQQDKTKPLQVVSRSYIGLLNGASGQSVLLETSVGVSRQNWFAGLGTGIDYYGTRTIPVFASLQKQFGQKKAVPVVYANGGIAYGWATEAQKMAKGYQYTDRRGGYFDGGVGVRVKTGGNTALMLTAGYNYKRVNEKAIAFNVWPRPVEGEVYEYYRYHYRRIVIKVGFSF